ncbi:restriction endonuclease subunit S [Corticibacter populi]|uniref:Restriction endonuclease subunit S n=1 Tax=Corticibacter populi TaxID=1550736 RepID=A0A3M6QSE8_9BURK|nr:restriction endonuclease subunit S [Corticibacter populi]RMX05955.1 restriction endonuclease subunit S [Corticibacter populi]RZS30721.1 type I restriction enzyme S subunit [Corticibacter populi]
MTAEWIETSLGDVVTLQRGIDLPVQDRQPGKFPVVASTGIAGFHNKAAANGPGVVIGRSGSIGGGQFIREDFWPLNTTLWVKDFHGNDPRFCYYLLRSMDFSSLNAGSGVPTLNRNHLHPLPVLRPPLEAQQSIANCLGSIDDKIDLSRRINQTLEAMAQAIFKSWFVDFDPVKAKIAAIEQGQDPLRAAMRTISGKTDTELDLMPREHHDQLAATAALFPDAMEDSELGEIPKGWKVGKLEDLLVLQRGFDLPSASREPGPYPIIAASGPSGTHSASMTKGPGVITGRSGILGKVFLELNDFWPLNTTLWVKDFRAANPCYAYETLKLLDFASFNAGSAVPTLNRNHIHTLPHLVPDKKCVVAYEALALILHQQVRSKEKQSTKLAQLRDTLLPKLISGELSVSPVTDKAAP